MTTHGGHGFAPEFPPVGMPGSAPPPLPRADGHAPRIVGALASSYMWSELMQARGAPGRSAGPAGMWAAALAPAALQSAALPHKPPVASTALSGAYGERGTQVRVDADVQGASADWRQLWQQWLWL